MFLYAELEQEKQLNTKKVEKKQCIMPLKFKTFLEGATQLIDLSLLSYIYIYILQPVFQLINKITTTVWSGTAH